MNRKNEKVPGITENYGLLTFEYAFRQAGFLVLLAIIAAATAGLFSSGAVSDTEKKNSRNTLAIDYERFGRRETEFPMHIAFPVKAPGEYVVSFSSESVDVWEPGSIWPQPDRMFSRGNTLFFVYNTLTQNEKFTVRLFLTPSKAGRISSVIRVNNEPEIAFWQLIYP
ncbi:hypothetical protein UXO11_02710 [Enterobacter wuhouensis]|uniref:hypothetical protein n=1 Tax=Enterobacter wuhouensis TaxID=2529381 RepID=UPI002FD00C82